MRLVKAAARFLVLACGLAGCPDPAPQAPDETQGACALVVTRPAGTRLRRVSRGGDITEVGPLSCASCVNGSSVGWVRKGPDGMHVSLGGGVRAFSPPAEPHMGGAKFPGVMIGHTFALLEEDGGLTVFDPTGKLPQRMPLPALEPGEQIAAARYEDGELFFAARRGDADPLRAVDERGHDPLWVHDRQGAHVARMDAMPPRAIVFPTGERIEIPGTRRPVSVEGDADKVIISRDRRHYIVWRTQGFEEVPPMRGTFLLSDGRILLADSPRRWIGFTRARGEIEQIIVAAEGRDLAGAPLPPGARVKRLSAAHHDGLLLTIERVEAADCTFEDRVHLVDLATRQVRTIASGPGMRMHPSIAGDAFLFVEADVELELP